MQQIDLIQNVLAAEQQAQALTRDARAQSQNLDASLDEEIARLKAENETLKKQLQTDEKPDDSGGFEVPADYEPDLMAIAMQPMVHKSRIKRIILRQ